MSREIKFRVWDKGEKQFWYFELQNLLERRMSYRGSWDEKILKGEKQQYTGLKDKNGKEIYEGDLVQVVGFDWEGLYKVEWDNDNSMYVSVDAYGDKEKLCEFEYMVKGNIYENPELLEG